MREPDTQIALRVHIYLSNYGYPGTPLTVHTLVIPQVDSLAPLSQRALPE